MNTEKRVPLTRAEKFWDIFGLVVILVVLALLVRGIESRAGDVMCYIGGAIAFALTVHDFKHGRIPDKNGEKSRSVFDNRFDINRNPGCSLIPGNDYYWKSAFDD